jgi:vacuolar-type H+-ATPase subunit I/STV1
MALPWILGGLAVATVAYLGSRDDDDNRSSSSNDRYEQEQEARRREKEAKREQLNRDITSFKENEKKRIQQKYNAQIEFSDASSFVGDGFGSNLVFVSKVDESLDNKINALEGEQDELKELIAQLKEEQNATNQ